MNEKNKKEEKRALLPPPDEGVRQQIKGDLLTSMFVEGGGGTGKTHLLVGRVVDLVADEGVAAHNIVVLAPSDEAATQVRRLLRIRLLERADEEAIKANAAGIEGDELFERVYVLRETAERSAQCFVGTFQGFCAQIVREQTKAASVVSEYRELDDNTEYCLRRRAWDEFVNHLHTTAKGRKLYKSLAEIAIEPEELWQVYATFVERADVDEWPTQEMPQPSLEEIWARIHQFVEPILPILADFPFQRGSDELMSVLEEIAYTVDAAGLEVPDDNSVIIRVLENFTWTPLVIENQWSSIQVALTQQRRFANFRTDFAEPFLARWRSYAYSGALKFLLAARDWYDGLRQRERLLSANDLILAVLRLLRECDDFVLNELRERFKYIFVDALQHFHPLAPEVISLLAAAEGSGRKWQKTVPRIGSLFITGDPRQSIDNAAAMNLSTYRAMRENLGAAGAIVELQANYRALQEIVKFVDCACGPNFPDPPTPQSPCYRSFVTGDQYWAEGELAGVFAYDVPGVASVAADGSMKFAPMVQSKVINWEAPFLARTIWHLVDQNVSIKRLEVLDEALKGPALRYSDFLLITQTSDDIPRYATALREHNIPYRIVGRVPGSDLVELHLLRQCVAAAVSFDDEAALVTALRSELFGVSDRELYEYRLAGGRFTVFADVPNHLSKKTKARFTYSLGRLKKYALWFERLLPISALRAVIDDLGIVAMAASYRNGRQRVKRLYDIIECVRQPGQTPQTTGELLEQLDMVLDGYTSQTSLDGLTGVEDSLRLASLQSACQLSAPFVFLAGVGNQQEEMATLHITEEKDRVCGYKVLKCSPQLGRARVLALPHDWQKKRSTENLILQAEKNRRVYVAATRARAALAIIRHNEDSVWASFGESLKEAEPLPKMKGRHRGQDVFKPMTEREMGYRQRPSLLEQKSYEKNLPVVVEKAEHVSSEDEIAAILTAGTPQISEATSAYKDMIGRWFGAGVHSRPTTGAKELPWRGLLSHFLKKSKEELLALELEDAVAEGESLLVNRTKTEEAFFMCQKLIKTKLWQKVEKSERLLIEAPFNYLITHEDDERIKTLRCNYIELAFEDKDALWTLVGLNNIVIDNSVEGEVLYEREVERMHELRQAWERDTGAWVNELAVMFTDGLPDEELAYHRIWQRPPEELVLDEEEQKAEPQEAPVEKPEPVKSDGPLWSDDIAVLLTVYSKEAAQYVEQWSRESSLPEPRVGVEVEADGHAVATALLMWRKGKKKVALLTDEEMPSAETKSHCQGWDFVQLDWEAPTAWYEEVHKGLRRSIKQTKLARKTSSGPRHYLCQTFTAALAKLTTMNQARVIEGLSSLIDSPDAFKSVIAAKPRDDGQLVYSISLSPSLEVVVTNVENDWYYLWAGPLNEADAEYKKHVVDKNESTGNYQLYVHPNTNKLAAQLARRAKVYEKMDSEVPEALLANVDEATLASWGVPEGWVPLISAIQTNDELAEVIPSLPEEAGEALLSHFAALKNCLALTSLVEEDDELSFEERRHFYLWSSKKEVRLWQKNNWLPAMEFLHPLQREAVLTTSRKPLLIEGSCGTGKTTVVLQRARYFAMQLNEKSAKGGRILLVTPSSHATANLVEQLAAFNPPSLLPFYDVHSIDDMAKIILQEADVVNPVSIYGAALGVIADGGFEIECSHIIIDDFHDMERAAIRLIAQLAEESQATLTLVGNENMRSFLPAFTWEEAGVGECTQCQPLIRDYRSSRLQRSLASEIATHCQIELRKAVALRRGIAPKLRGFASATEESNWLAEIIVGLVEDRNIPLSRIALIAPDDLMMSDEYINTFERVGVLSARCGAETKSDSSLIWYSYEQVGNLYCDHLFLIALQEVEVSRSLVKAILQARKDIALSWSGARPDYLVDLISD